MKDKELYQQKIQAQLNEWKADIDKLRAKVSMSNADSQLDMNRNLRVLESKIEEGKEKIREIAGVGEGVWDSARQRMQSAWELLKSEADDAAAKLKR